LGNTIEEIALDKSCIIKSAAVTAATGKGLKILKEVCKSRKIPLKIVGEDVKWERIGQRKFLVKAKRNYEVVTAMNGKYQGENIALAIAAIESLSNYGIDLRKESIIEGISMTKLPGRLEILERKPRILLDGAHNPAAFLALREFLEKDIDYDQLILVMGILKDKDIRSMVGIIAPLADHIILTKVRNERACDPKIIAREIKTIEPNEPKMIIEPTVERAINFARSISRADDLICVCGSLYLVGEARDYLMNIPS
jgi:dihydrofolate synthase/folylpolyglutamate synthase